MRINIYAEELTDRVELVKKSPENHPGVDFYGVRFYLDSPQTLHRTPDDDDSSAVTLWIPWKKATGNQPGVVAELLEALLAITGSIPV